MVCSYDDDSVKSVMTGIYLNGNSHVAGTWKRGTKIAMDHDYAT